MFSSIIAVNILYVYHGYSGQFSYQISTTKDLLWFNYTIGGLYISG